MAFTVWTCSVALQLLYIKRMDIPNYITSTFVYEYQILHAIEVGFLFIGRTFSASKSVSDELAEKTIGHPVTFQGILV